MIIIINITMAVHMGLNREILNTQPYSEWTRSLQEQVGLTAPLHLIFIINLNAESPSELLCCF